jgi:hypothetical protein
MHHKKYWSVVFWIFLMPFSAIDLSLNAEVICEYSIFYIHAYECSLFLKWCESKLVPDIICF